MWRFLIAILLSFALIISSSGDLLLLFVYKIQQNTIEQRFCINKAQPEKHCHGKCHLQASLQEKHQNEQKPLSHPKPEVNDKPLWVCSNDKPSLWQLPDIQRKNYFPYLPPKGITSVREIFHPPQKG